MEEQNPAYTYPESGAETAAPLLSLAAADTAVESTFAYGNLPVEDSDCTYVNAATCPECGSAMAKMGHCFSCLGCGFGSCSG